MENSKEYKDGFVTNCKIIEINNINVESYTAQQIANKLNIIKLPFIMILDYTEAIISINDLKILLKQKKKSTQKKPPLSSTQSIMVDGQNSNFDDSNESKSAPSSPKIVSSSISLMDDSTSFNTITNNRYDIGPIDDDTEYEYNGHPHLYTDDNDIEEEKYQLQKISSNQERDLRYISPERKQSVSYQHGNNGNNPYRQFSVVYNNHNFDLCLQFRNGYNLFMDNKHRKTYSVPQSLIWGWYTIKEDKHIPIGSKLIMINGRYMTNGYNANNINQLLKECSLPITLIFEAPSYLKHTPRSTYIQYQHVITDHIQQQHIVDSQQNIKIFVWWLEEGGLVTIILLLLAFIVLDWPLEFVKNRWYLIFMFICCIPDAPWNLFYFFFMKNGRGLILPIGKRKNLCHPFNIVNEHRLNIHGQHHRKYNKSHIEQQQKQEQKDSKNKKKEEESPSVVNGANEDRKEEEEQPLISNKDDESKDIEHDGENDDIEDEEEEEEIIDSSQIDPNWEINYCHPSGNKEIWGSYALGSSPLLSVRGSTYLNDKIKIKSKQALFNIGHIEVFESHKTIDCMAQNEASWFYQNKSKFPLNIFFFIFHLRLDSLNCSIVIYWYCDKDKYKSLLQSNNKISSMAKEKGDGYFCVGSNNYDESGMFWNFINGECQYRNDRLKMIARKEEGSWYLHIPSTPAIIAKKIPMIYYRAYNKKKLNSIKTFNSKSQQYETYNFKTLYNEKDKDKKIIKNKNKLPCDCGRCYWIDTKNKYPEYIELHFNPESASPIAKNTIKIAAGVTKSLSWELHFLLEGQRNNIELPETVLANARISYIHLDHMIAID